MKDSQKYQRNVDFKPFAEILALNPPQRSNEQSRLMKENAKIAEENFIRRRNQGVTNIDLEYRGEEVIHRNNARIAKLQAEYGFDPWSAIPQALKAGAQVTDAWRRTKTLEAKQDLDRLTRIAPDVRKKLDEGFRKNVRYNEETVQKGAEWAWTAELQGESKAVVDKILTGTGFYGAAIRQFNLSEAKKHFTNWIKNQSPTKFYVEDQNFTGEISLDEYESALTDEKDPLHDIVTQDYTLGGDRSLKSKIQQHMKMSVYEILSDPDGYFRYNEYMLSEHFDPLVEDLYEKTDMETSGNHTTFVNKKIVGVQNNLLTAAIDNPNKSQGAIDLVNAVKAFAEREGGSSTVFLNNFNQMHELVFAGAKTKESVDGLIHARFDPKEAGIKGYENYKGTISLAEWRKKEWEQSGGDVRLQESVDAYGNQAKEERKNAVTNIQGQIAAYVEQNKGAYPPRELIRDWIDKYINGVGAGGYSPSKLFNEVTKDMGTSEGESIADEIRQMESAYTASRGKGLVPEQYASFSSEAIAHAQKNNWFGNSAYDLEDDEALTKGIDAAVKTAREITGDFDDLLTQWYLNQYGNKVLPQRFRDIMINQGGDKTDVLSNLITKWHDEIKANPDAWRIRKTKSNQIRKNLNNALEQYNLTKDSTKLFNVFEKDGRIEQIIVQLDKGATLNQDMTFVDRDGQRRKVFDSFANQLASRLQMPVTQLFTNQLSGLDVELNPDTMKLAAFKADPWTARQMAKGINKTAVNVNSSIKQETLDALGVELPSEQDLKKYKGAKINELTPYDWTELTGIDFINEDAGAFLHQSPDINSILHKLGIKKYDRFEPKMIPHIQKRVLGLYGAMPFTNAPDEARTGFSPFKNIYLNPNNLHPGLSKFSVDTNAQHFEGKEIRYRAAPPGTMVGTTKKGLFNEPVVYTVISEGEKVVTLGWRPLRSEKNDWVKQLAETNGNIFGFKSMAADEFPDKFPEELK